MPLRTRASTAVLAVLVGCVGRPAERPRAPMLQDAVELHVMLPLSGDAAERGDLARAVVGRAVAALNESRLPAERPLQAVLHDSGSTHDASSAKAAALIDAGVIAFVGPADATPAFGLGDHLDRTDTLVLMPDAREFPADFGGESTLALLPPSALRGRLLIEEGLRRVADARTLSWSRPPGVDPTAAAQLGLETAVGAGLVRTLDAEADLRLLSADAAPPHDLQLRVGTTTLQVAAPEVVWRDPALTMEGFWAVDERATSATYDAVIVLGRALRRSPEADAATLRQAVLADRWEGCRGPARFHRPVEDGPAYAHPPMVR